MQNINLPIPEELLEAVDQARGDIPRTVWIRRTIEHQLSNEDRLRAEIERLDQLIATLRREDR